MRRFTDVNYYEVLGVPTSATRDEIRAAYRARVRSAHPDAGGEQEEFAKISEAWEVLGNPDEREHYDADRRLKARASRRYAPKIDRNPRTGSWSTEGVVSGDGPDPAKVDDDGLTPAQRWRRDKRRL